jgi:hypothetical protein
MGGVSFTTKFGLLWAYTYMMMDEANHMWEVWNPAIFFGLYVFGLDPIWKCVLALENVPCVENKATLKGCLLWVNYYKFFHPTLFWKSSPLTPKISYLSVYKKFQVGLLCDQKYFTPFLELSNSAHGSAKKPSLLPQQQTLENHSFNTKLLKSLSPVHDNLDEALPCCGILETGPKFWLVKEMALWCGWKSYGMLKWLHLWHWGHRYVMKHSKNPSLIFDILLFMVIWVWRGKSITPSPSTDKHG